MLQCHKSIVRIISMNNIYGEKTKTIHTQTKAKVTIISSNTFFYIIQWFVFKTKEGSFVNTFLYYDVRKKNTQTNSQLQFL